MVDTSFVKGKTAVLFGGTTGLGVGLADVLAAAELKCLWVVCRSQAKGDSLKDRVEKQYPGISVRLAIADACSMEAVRNAGKQIAAETAEVHLLLLNAATIVKSRKLTKEGLEECFAVNHLSFCALTAALLPTLVKSKPARIVITGSKAANVVKWTLDWDNLQGEKGIRGVSSGFKTYGQSKCMNLVYAVELAARLQAAGHPEVTVNTWHPGAVKTNIGNDISPCLASCLKALFSCAFRDPATAAQLGLYLSGANAVASTSGCFFSSGNSGKVRNFEPVPLEGHAADLDARRRFWDISEKLLGEPLLGGVVPDEPQG
eukprot:TRINITY_DN7260_c2_g1_i6.p1 TRINITY_DN7260_c2_g1~~TRINITY_DN7260_c2_g1_i6.p1  ORF type:complete len:317 (-),score=42.61 TRINITY_DN7260_c2_g1_i6:266-1216(-)